MSLPPIATDKTSPNQSARNGAPRFIVIHHWGSMGQRFSSVVSWLTQSRSRVSAHYVVEGGRVARIVDESRRAWHAGSNNGNHYGIGIECRPEATDADYATVAALVRNIRDRRGDLPLRPHSAFVDTACPGRWDLARIDREARRGSSAPAPVPSSGGRLAVDGRAGVDTMAALQRFLNAGRGGTLDVDGRAGEDTWSALQRYLNAPYVDGRISRQSYRPHELGNGIVDRATAWEHTGRRSEGSQTVELLQSWTGAGADGIWFEGTTRALQRKLNDHGIGM